VQKAQDQRYDVLQSSSELGWSNLFAEVRSYGRGGGTHPADPETKIAILLDGSEGTSGCRIGGSWRLSEHILVRRIGRSSRRQHGTRQRLAHES